MKKGSLFQFISRLFQLSLFLSWQLALSQTPHIDSLVNLLNAMNEDTFKINTLNALCNEYIIELNNLEKATNCADQQLKLSQKIKYKKGIAEGLLNYGTIYLNRGDFGMALSYQKKALDIMKELQSKKGESDCYLNLGWSYSVQGDYDEALEYLFLAVQLKKTINDKKGIADAYNYIGNSNKNMGNYAKGLNYNFQALKIREEINDVRGISKSYSNIGLILKRQGKYDEALYNYDKALKLKEKINDRKGKASVYNNIGDIYFARNRYDESVNFYMKSLELSKEVDDKLGIIISYNSLGDVYLKQKQTDKALYYELKSFSLSKAMGLKKQFVNACNSIGKAYEEKEDYLRALSYYNEMLHVALEMGYKSGVCDAYANYASVYRKLNQFEEALRYTKLYHDYKDTLLNKENFRQMTELNTQYETDKKEKEILLLTKEQQLNSKIIKQQKLVRWGLIGGLGLLFISVVSIYRRYRFKHDANLTLEKQKQEIREKNMLITDSIDYAKTIQEVVLPNDRIMKALLPESFVLYQPKEIVSGDFYWIKKIENKILCAVADCNGKGVPGAFMSLLGYNMLENTVKEGNDVPADVLNKLDAELISRWSRDGRKVVRYTLKMALIRIDTATNQLHYAGANNSIYIVRENKVIEFNPDKVDIGSVDKHSNHRFRPQLIQLQTGDMIYLATKGYEGILNAIHPTQDTTPAFHELLVSIHKLNATEQRKKLEEAYLSCLNETQEQPDDILIIGISC